MYNIYLQYSCEHWDIHLYSACNQVTLWRRMNIFIELILVWTDPERKQVQYTKKKDKNTGCTHSNFFKCCSPLATYYALSMWSILLHLWNYRFWSDQMLKHGSRSKVAYAPHWQLSLHKKKMGQSFFFLFKVLILHTVFGW